jgi:hypothetical protein
LRDAPQAQRSLKPMARSLGSGFGNSVILPLMVSY